MRRGCSSEHRLPEAENLRGVIKCSIEIEVMEIEAQVSQPKSLTLARVPTMEAVSKNQFVIFTFYEHT